MQNIAQFQWPIEERSLRYLIFGTHHVCIILSSPPGFCSFSRPVGSLRDRHLVHLRYPAWRIAGISRPSCWPKDGRSRRILVAPISVVLSLF
jgi:hypothetical protein